MVRKAFRTGNSVVVSLPQEALDYLNIHAGMPVNVTLDRKNRQLIIKPAALPFPISGVDETFARQVAEFINQYRPALEQLAK